MRYCILAILCCSAITLRADEIPSPGVETPAIPAPNATPILETPALAPVPAPPWNGDLWTRSKVSGDWLGSRNLFAEYGVTFYGDITQYYQGPAIGGLSNQFKYGGRADYLIDIDTGKMGLWKGGRIDLRGETRLGQDTNGIDGIVAPSNFAMNLPVSGKNETALTGLQYTQDFSENFSMFFGKLNLLDGTPASYNRGMRLNYFLNAGMQGNLSRIYLVPSTLGTGFTIRDEGEPVFNFFLLDTFYKPTSSGLPTLFSNGVLMYGEYRIRTNWFNLPGHSSFGLLHSNASRALLDLNPSVQLQALRAGASLESKSSAWSVIYRLDQVLYADPEDPKRNWSLSSDFGLTDGNPNPIRWFANATIVGNSPLAGRKYDKIGVGYYHLGASENKVVRNLGFGTEDGVELFYNIAVTPWFNLTPDVQIVKPAQTNNPTTLLVGIRGKLSF